MQAYAANCGGAIACNCGDNLTTSRTLNASDNLIGCTGNGLVINGSGLTLDCNGVSIIGGGTDNGLHVISDDIVITDCIIMGFAHGIVLLGSSNTLIDSNDIQNNIADGIYLVHLPPVYPTLSNNVTDNVISNNLNGIQLQSSFDNIINQNNIDGNTGVGVLLQGSMGSNSFSFNNISNSNEGVFLQGSSDAILTENDIFDNDNYGVHIQGSDNTFIENNFYDNDWGVFIQSSPDNVFTQNSFNDNDDYGIFMENSYNNDFTQNDFINSDYGVYLETSYDNDFDLNELTDNLYGLYLNGSYDNDFIENTLTDNIQGFNLSTNSIGNELTENTVNDNTLLGISFSNLAINNILRSNTVCSNNQDIISLAANTGFSNTCGASSAWNDTLTTGCTNRCTPTSSSSSCGGGGSSTPPLTFDLFEPVFGFSTFRGGALHFRYKDTKYKIDIERYNNDYSMLSINFGRKGFELLIGEPFDLDLNNDGQSDVKLTYEGISTAARREILMKIEPYEKTETMAHVQTVAVEVVEEDPIIQTIVEEVKEEKVIEEMPEVFKNKVKIEHNPTNHMAIGLTIMAITILGFLTAGYLIRRR